MTIPPPQPPNPGPASDDVNPYAAPTLDTLPASSDPVESLPPDDAKLARTIVQDANQVLVAILLCVFCSVVGGVIVPIWYLFRLLQWTRLANAYPELLAPNPPLGSLADGFRRARNKLIGGAIAGTVLLMLCSSWFLFGLFA